LSSKLFALFLHSLKKRGVELVAQLVEQYTFNVWALGSSPSQITCIDLARRLYEHNIGHSKFTSTGIPWELKWQEDFASLQEAKRRELQIKKMKSRKYIEGLIAQL
jgi:putative endonuclease